MGLIEHVVMPIEQVQHAGDLRDPRARPHLASAVIGGSPRRRGNLENRAADIANDGEPDRVGQPSAGPGQLG